MKKSILKSIMTLALLIGASGVMGQEDYLEVIHRQVDRLGFEVEEVLEQQKKEADKIKHLKVISYVDEDGKSVGLTDSDYSTAESNKKGFRNVLTNLEIIDLSEATNAAMPGFHFVNNTKLKKIHLPSNVKIIGSSAFKNSKLESVESWGLVETINKEAFSGCANLVITEFPNTLKTIGEDAFLNCTNVTVNELPEGLETIGQQGLRGTKVTISKWPSAIKAIGNRAFAVAPVTFTTWPEHITTITPGVFVNCYQLTEFTIPTTVTTVGGSAFHLDEPTTRNIYIHNHEKVITFAGDAMSSNRTNPFSSNGSLEINQANVTLYVSPSARNLYKTAENWKEIKQSVYATGSTTLSGTWSQAELEAMNITSTDLTDIDMSGITIPGGVTLSGATNPNLLVYVGTDDDITINGPGNLIKDGAINNLTLTDRAPFNAPANITGAISYERTMAPLQSGNPALETICLPFTATVPTGCRAMAMADGGNDAEINLTEVSTMIANTPYVIYPDAAAGSTVTFTGTSIVATSMIDNEASVNYVLKGTFANNRFEKGSGIYVSDGSSFRPAAGATLAPFRAYLELKEDAPEGASAVYAKEPGTTGIDVNRVTDGGLQLYSVNDQLYVNSPVAKLINIYGIDGRLVRTERIDEGETSISGLAKGIYIIEQQKVIVR